MPINLAINILSPLGVIIFRQWVIYRLRYWIGEVDKGNGK